MLDSSHRFFVSLLDEAGKTTLRREAKSLQPIYEDLLFCAVLQGSVANDGTSPRAKIEPAFDGDRVTGLRASLAGMTKLYPLEVFHDQALELLAAEKLPIKSGHDEVRIPWAVDAETKREEPSNVKLRVAVTREPFPFDRATLSYLGIDTPREPAEPFSLFVSSALLKELRDETAASLEMERANVLTGRLTLDPARGTALVLLGRIPFSTGTESSLTHFSFSPLAFEEVMKAHRLRCDGLSICGWQHNHPPACGRKCLQIVPACKTSNVFLSPSDRSVFRASFPAAYMVGLVSGKGPERRADDPVIRAYGWQDGTLKEMNYAAF